MTFDFGEVLQHAWQITWKHKVLWLFSALPMVLVVFYLSPVFYLLLSNDFRDGVPDFLNNPASLGLFFIILIVTALLSFVLQVFSRSATTFGILQIEAGKSRPTFGDISNGGRRFFWRILGATLLVSLVALVFFAAFSACVSAIGFVTFGIGSLIGQILFLPATLFIYAITEQSQAAVVADALSPTDAVVRAWDLVTENIGIFALVTIVLYFGLSVFSSIVLLPVIAPLLLFVFNRVSDEFSNPTLLRVAVLCVTAFMPVYLILQAGAMLYVKSAFMVIYLRLTRSLKLQHLPGTAEAAS